MKRVRLTINDPRVVATHESGHAVVATLLNVSFRSVSVLRRGRLLGRVNGIVWPASLEGEENLAVAMASGPAAELLLTGQRNLEGASLDYAELEPWAIEAAEHFAGVLLKEPPVWAAVNVVAKALLVRRRLRAGEVRRLVREGLRSCGKQ